MEIKYSNTEPDVKIFEKKNLYGFYDKNSNYLANRIANIETKDYKTNFTVKRFLNSFAKRNNNHFNLIKEEFKITSDMEKKRLLELTNVELISILIVKLYFSKAKVIILDHIDAFITTEALKNIMLHIKNTIVYTDKIVIFSANKIDNIIATTSNYVIASENRIIYNGNNIESLHEQTEIMKFVNTANQKGAKLSYYKDAKDLLKAIYRSVKK